MVDGYLDRTNKVISWALVLIPHINLKQIQLKSTDPDTSNLQFETSENDQEFNQKHHLEHHVEVVVAELTEGDIEQLPVGVQVVHDCLCFPDLNKYWLKLINPSLVWSSEQIWSCSFTVQFHDKKQKFKFDKSV